MKITAKHLRRLIREEFTRVVLEGPGHESAWSFEPVGGEGKGWPGTPGDGHGLPRYHPVTGDERSIFGYHNAMDGNKYAIYGDLTGPDEPRPGGAYTLPGGPDPKDQAALRADLERRSGLEANPRPKRTAGGGTTVTGDDANDKYILLVTEPLPREWSKPRQSRPVPAVGLANEIDTFSASFADSGVDPLDLRNKTDLMVVRVRDNQVVAVNDGSKLKQKDPGIGTFVWDTIGSTPALINLVASNTTATFDGRDPYPKISSPA